MNATDIQALRREFPVTEKWVYMNHAGVAPISRRVQRAMQSQLRNAVQHGMVQSDKWESAYARTRRSTAHLIGARPSEIAFVKNTTEGIQIVANGLNWRRGDNVVISQRGFPANVYPWLNLATRGVETRFAHEQNGRIPIENIFENVDERTRLISISSVEFASGFRHNLHQIGAFCKERDILFFVDGIQSLGALQIDVKESGIHFLSADAHKWLLGPEGAGIFFCARSAMRHIKHINLGWASVVNPGDYLSYDTTPLPNAQRFESGTLNTVGIYGLRAALELIEHIGIDIIESRILVLTDQLTAGLREKGYEVISSRTPDEKSGIVAFQHAKHPVEMLFQHLKDHNVIGAVRGGHCRLSPHVYNSEDEIDHALDALPD